MLFNPEIEQETCVGATKQGLLSKSVVLSKSILLTCGRRSTTFPVCIPEIEPLHYKSFCRYRPLFNSICYTLSQAMRIINFITLMFRC